MFSNCHGACQASELPTRFKVSLRKKMIKIGLVMATRSLNAPVFCDNKKSKKIKNKIEKVESKNAKTAKISAVLKTDFKTIFDRSDLDRFKKASTNKMLTSKPSSRKY
jgi:hypothetical protein